MFIRFVCAFRSSIEPSCRFKLAVGQLRKLCTTMKTEDVTDTLQLALIASGCDQARVVHKPRLLNGPSYISGELAEWLD